MDYRTEPVVVADELLVAELHRLGLTHLARFTTETPASHLPAAEFIAALAAHSLARMQATLLLLFLRRPDYETHLNAALSRLDDDPAMSLKLYYQAAVYLQRELAVSLQPYPACRRSLPDLFSAELGLPPAASILPGDRTAQAALAGLGQRHQQHSGWQFNWAGSYRQHLPHLLKHLG